MTNKPETVLDVLRAMRGYEPFNVNDKENISMFLDRLAAAQKYDQAQHVCPKCNALRTWQGEDVDKQKYLCSSCGEPAP